MDILNFHVLRMKYNVVDRQLVRTRTSLAPDVPDGPSLCTGSRPEQSGCRFGMLSLEDVHLFVSFELPETSVASTVLHLTQVHEESDGDTAGYPRSS